MIICFLIGSLNACVASATLPEEPEEGILFQSDRDGSVRFYLLSKTKEETVELTFPDLPVDSKIEGFSWSSKTEKWFFSLTNELGNDVYSFDVNGQNIKKITDTPMVTKAPLAVSPDGMQISFVGYSLGADILIVESTGDDYTNLTPYKSTDHYPVWTPDNKHIVFRSDYNGLPNIYMIDIDGKNLTNISNGPGVDGLFSVSSDGSRIVFDSDREGSRDLFVANLGEDSYVNITKHPARDIDPKWSPDSQYVLFKSDRDGGEDLYLLKLSDNSVIRLTNSPDNGELNPIWCLDSQCIIFNANLNGQQDIFQVNLDGSIVNLTNSPANEYSPQIWSEY